MRKEQDNQTDSIDGLVCGCLEEVNSIPKKHLPRIKAAVLAKKNFYATDDDRQNSYFVSKGRVPACSPHHHNHYNEPMSVLALDEHINKYHVMAFRALYALQDLAASLQGKHKQDTIRYRARTAQPAHRISTAQEHQYVA